MDVFQILLLLLSGFGACHWSVVAQKQEVDKEAMFKGLWSQHLREVLTKKDPGPFWRRDSLQRQLLYCRVGIGFHLQILSGGAVRGVHMPNESCWLKVYSMKQGVVAIQGEKSELFLCMSELGLVYATDKFSDECLLKETLEENHYNTYSSDMYPGVYLALSHRGLLKRGVTRHQRCAHFLPRRIL